MTLAAASPRSPPSSSCHHAGQGRSHVIEGVDSNAPRRFTRGLIRALNHRALPWLGLQVIAEGVERPEQLAVLAQYGPSACRAICSRSPVAADAVVSEAAKPRHARVKSS